jgi:hypothetical protein
MDENQTEKNRLNYKNIHLTKDEFTFKCNELMFNIKNNFGRVDVKWVAEFCEDAYNLLLNYQCLVLDCENLKQVRHCLEKCLECLDEISDRSERMRILMTDVKPICKCNLDKIIWNDLHLIYTPYEVNYMMSSLNNLQNNCIKKVVNNILGSL